MTAQHTFAKTWENENYSVQEEVVESELTLPRYQIQSSTITLLDSVFNFLPSLKKKIGAIVYHTVI
jgi:hypothetical protein